jgi:hypothetical protein
VESALRWFDATHELESHEGHWRYRRVGLPGAGSLSEQDPLLMEALDWLRLVHNDMVKPRVKAPKTDG